MRKIINLTTITYTSQCHEYDGPEWTRDMDELVPPPPRERLLDTCARADSRPGATPPDINPVIPPPSFIRDNEPIPNRAIRFIAHAALTYPSNVIASAIGIGVHRILRFVPRTGMRRMVSSQELVEECAREWAAWEQQGNNTQEW